MPKHLITYRGHEMVAGWPAKIRAAQRQKTVTRDSITYPRIPYGQEGIWAEFAMEPHPTCGDCGVIPGEFHVEHCDVEVCPICRTGQWLSCIFGSCGKAFAEELDDIQQLKTTHTDVYAPKIHIPDDQIPLL